jgi:isoaspartyl peptidase/L-asparaginase-like protein (Ntn-hydrolase superfamily)
MFSTWSFAARGHAAAWPALAGGGASLDAVEAAARVVESDPDVDSVGYGGLPDAAGDMSLDGCVMLSPERCGSVCAVRRHLHVVSLARRVMEDTPHVMLAGPDADDFADDLGMPEQDLLAPEARARWERWRRDPQVVDQSLDRGYAPPRPIDTGAGGRLFAPDEPGGHDTVSVLALDGAGHLAGSCSTSGTPFKSPGRVGDSPIIGHGLYVDPGVGAAAATGTGEMVMGLCSSFHVVEEMRRGATPNEAVRAALERIPTSFTIEPHHQVAIIALHRDGRRAAAALHDGFKSVVTDEAGTRVEDPDVVVLPR